MNVASENSKFMIPSSIRQRLFVNSLDVQPEGLFLSPRMSRRRCCMRRVHRTYILNSGHPGNIFCDVDHVGPHAFLSFASLIPCPPLPLSPLIDRRHVKGFHQETYEDADAQLQAVMPLLLDQFIPTSLLALGEDSLDDWLSAALGNANLPAGRVEESQSTPEGTARGTRQGVAALLPSVRCGIEMALLHLLAGASGVPIAVAVSAALGLPCRGAIEINGLAARGELSSGKDVRGHRSRTVLRANGHLFFRHCISFLLRDLHA